MTTVSFILPDASMPRTVYYDLFAAAVRRSSRYTEDLAEADICLPAEDIALETNWPRYYRRARKGGAEIRARVLSRHRIPSLPRKAVYAS